MTRMDSVEGSRTRIVIAGGGAAGLEAMLALRALGGDRADVELFAPKADFRIRPLSVWKELGRGEVVSYDLRELTERAGARFSQHGVFAVEPAKRRVILRDDTEVPYDYFLLATGTKSIWEVPGARTFWGPGSEQAIDEFRDLRNSIGPSRLILTTPDLATWPIPVYELALFLAAEARVSTMSNLMITVATPEKTPLQAFGEEVSGQMASLLASKRIEFLPEVHPLSFAEGRLHTRSGDSIPADGVITLPALTGRRVEGIDFTGEGFVRVDESGRIEGLEREYAAGDVTEGDLKFGGFATARADVAAAAIAARAWSVPDLEATTPELHGTLLTAEGPISVVAGQGLGRAGTDSGDWNPSEKIRGKYLTPFLTGKPG